MGLSEDTGRRRLSESTPEEGRSLMLGLVGGALLTKNRLKKTRFDGGVGGLKSPALGASKWICWIHFSVEKADIFFQDSRVNKSPV